MNRKRHIAGVTLLEIMLVLAIAAMIIVMSIRYYQSATAGSQANAVYSQIIGIVAAADQLSQASGSYSGATSAAVEPLLPANTLTTPWAAPINVTPGKNTIVITVNSTPQSVCTLLSARLVLNNHFTITTPCAATGLSSLGVTYTSNV